MAQPWRDEGQRWLRKRLVGCAGVPPAVLEDHQPGLVRFLTEHPKIVVDAIPALFPINDQAVEAPDVTEDVLLEKYMESMRWVDWVMCGSDPDIVLASVAEATDGNTRGVCGAVWGSKDIAYRCKDCENDVTCAICVPCFLAGNHEGHDYTIIMTGQGCCDCGDPTAWRESGFCKFHKGPGKAPPLPEAFENRARPVLEAVVQEWVRRLEVATTAEGQEEGGDESPSSSRERKGAEAMCRAVSEDLVKICAKGESLGRLIASVAGDTRWKLVDAIIKYEHASGRPMAKEVYELLYKLLADPSFKEAFARVFVDLYPLLRLDSTYDDLRLDRLPPLCMFNIFSVQIFTVPPLVIQLVKEAKLLEALFTTLVNSLASSWREDGRNQSKEAVRHHVLDDLRYVLTHLEAAVYATHQRTELAEKWVQILAYTQGMGGQVRLTAQHVEMDSEDWRKNFEIELLLARIKPLIVQGANAPCMEVCREVSGPCELDRYRNGDAQGPGELQTESSCSMAGDTLLDSSAGQSDVEMTEINEVRSDTEMSTGHGQVLVGGGLKVPGPVVRLIEECVRVLVSWLSVDAARETNRQAIQTSETSWRAGGGDRWSNGEEGIGWNRPGGGGGGRGNGNRGQFVTRRTVRIEQTRLFMVGAVDGQLGGRGGGAADEGGGIVGEVGVTAAAVVAAAAGMVPRLAAAGGRTNRRAVAGSVHVPRVSLQRWFRRRRLGNMDTEGGGGGGGGIAVGGAAGGGAAGGGREEDARGAAAREGVRFMRRVAQEDASESHGDAGRTRATGNSEELPETTGRDASLSPRGPDSPWLMANAESPGIEWWMRSPYVLQGAAEASAKEMEEMSSSEQWPEIKFNVSTQEVTFHIPLHRMLALMLHSVVNSAFVVEEGGRGDDKKRRCKNSTEASLSFIKELLPTKHRKLGFAAVLMEHPLRVQVLCAQIAAGMWRRNGLSVVYLAECYKSVHWCSILYSWCEESLELDLFLLQCCAVISSPEDFVERVQSRFGLAEYFGLDSSQPAEYESSLAEEVLLLLIRIVTERAFCGLGTAEAVRRELIQRLAAGDATHSSLVKALPPRLQESRHVQECLDAVALYTTPLGMEQGKYTLRQECWQELDLYHPRWSPRELQLVEDRYQSVFKVSAATTQLPKWKEAYPPFEPLRHIATTECVHNIVRSILHYAAIGHSDPASRAPEGVLLAALQLLALGLDVCSIKSEEEIELEDGNWVVLGREWKGGLKFYHEQGWNCRKGPPPLLSFACEKVEMDDGPAAPTDGQVQETCPKKIKHSLLSLMVVLMRRWGGGAGGAGTGPGMMDSIGKTEVGKLEVSDLIQRLLMQFADLDAKCKQEIAKMAPDLVKPESVQEEDEEKQQQQEEEKKVETSLEVKLSAEEKRREKARAYQAAIMASMRKEQVKFAESMISMDDSDEDDDVNEKDKDSLKEKMKGKSPVDSDSMRGVEEPGCRKRKFAERESQMVCAMCREPEGGPMSKALCYITYIQRSRLLAIAMEPTPSWELGYVPRGFPQEGPGVSPPISGRSGADETAALRLAFQGELFQLLNEVFAGRVVTGGEDNGGLRLEGDAIHFLQLLQGGGRAVTDDVGDGGDTDDANRRRGIIHDGLTNIRIGQIRFMGRDGGGELPRLTTVDSLSQAAETPPEDDSGMSAEVSSESGSGDVGLDECSTCIREVGCDGGWCESNVLAERNVRDDRLGDQVIQSVLDEYVRVSGLVAQERDREREQERRGDSAEPEVREGWGTAGRFFTGRLRLGARAWERLGVSSGGGEGGSDGVGNAHDAWDSQFLSSVGLHVSTCGHGIHAECLERYFSSLLDRYRTRMPYEAAHLVDPEAGEFLCPMCRRVGNSFLPIFRMSWRGSVAEHAGDDGMQSGRHADTGHQSIGEGGRNDDLRVASPTRERSFGLSEVMMESSKLSVERPVGHSRVGKELQCALMLLLHSEDSLRHGTKYQKGGGGQMPPKLRHPLDVFASRLGVFARQDTGRWGVGPRHICDHLGLAIWETLAYTIASNELAVRPREGVEIVADSCGTEASGGRASTSAGQGSSAGGNRGGAPGSSWLPLVGPSVSAATRLGALFSLVSEEKGAILPPLLEAAQAKKGHNRRENLLRARGLQMLVGAVVWGISRDSPNRKPASTGERSASSTMDQYLEIHKNDEDVRFWRRTANPTLVEDPFFTLVRVVFCLPVHTPSSSLSFKSLVFLLYLVCLTQIIAHNSQVILSSSQELSPSVGSFLSVVCAITRNTAAFASPSGRQAQPLSVNSCKENHITVIRRMTLPFLRRCALLQQLLFGDVAAFSDVVSSPMSMNAVENTIGGLGSRSAFGVSDDGCQGQNNAGPSDGNNSASGMEGVSAFTEVRWVDNSQQLVAASLRPSSSREASCSGTAKRVVRGDLAAELEEISILEREFSLPDVSDVLGDDAAMVVVIRWCQHVAAEFSGRNIDYIPRPTLSLPFRLMPLPSAYEVLFRRYVKEQCPKCKTVPERPALCLLCGRLCCYRPQRSCCSVQRQGECYRHAKKCGAGIGVYLLLRETQVFLMRGDRHGLWGSPYLDAYGEEDVGLRRGKPLYLSEARYLTLTMMVGSQGLDHNSFVLSKTTRRDGHIY